MDDTIALKPGQFNNAPPIPAPTANVLPRTPIASTSPASATPPTSSTSPAPLYDNVTGARTDAGKAAGVADMSGGKPVAPISTPTGTAPIPRVSPTAPTTTPAEDYLSGKNFTPPPTEEQNYKTLLDRASGLITSINSGYQDKLNSANAASAARVNAGGLAGSTSGGKIYTEAEQPIIDERNTALEQVYNNIQSTADSLTLSEKQQATSDAEASVDYTRQAKADALASATDSIKALAANHLDWNAYKTQNPDSYNALVKAVGGDPNVADAMFALNVPSPEVAATWNTSDGNGGTTIWQQRIDPVTQTPSIVKFDLPGTPLPQNWTAEKIGTNAQIYKAPNFNPSDPSTYVLMSADPTNGGAITVTQNGITTVNGVPVNNDTSGSSANGTGAAPAAPQVASLIGLQDPSQPLSDVIGQVNIGVDGVVNGIIANEGGSPTGVINNPGNIKFVGQSGATNSGVKAADGGTFASFPTKQDGLTAIGDLVQKASNDGETFDQFINKYTGTTPQISQNQDFATTGEAPTDQNSSQMYVTANGVNTGLTHEGIYQAALDYASNQKLPPTGIGSNAQAKAIRTSIVNKASALVASVGLTLPQYQALYKADQATVNQNIQRLGKIDSTSVSLSSQFPRLAELASTVGTGITESDINAGAAATQEKFGSPDAASYVELLQTVRSDYSALQAGVAGSRGGQFFSETAQQAIPAGLTPAQYKSIQQTIEQSAKNSATAIKGTVSDQFSNLGDSSSNSGPTTLTPDEATQQPEGTLGTSSDGTSILFHDGKWQDTNGNTYDSNGNQVSMITPSDKTLSFLQNNGIDINSLQDHHISTLNEKLG